MSKNKALVAKTKPENPVVIRGETAVAIGTRMGAKGRDGARHTKGRVASDGPRGRNVMDPIEAEVADAERTLRAGPRAGSLLLGEAPYRPWVDTGRIYSRIDGPLAPAAERIAALREALR